MADCNSERTIRPPTWHAVLFDLDGTLLDTLRDIADSANAVLADHGCPTHPVRAYRHFVGDGVATLFSRALPNVVPDSDLHAQCVEEFRKVYGQNWNVSTQPYPGVIDLLRSLQSRRIRMAVFSNKPDPFVQQCVDRYLPPDVLELAIGQRNGIPHKPDPTGAQLIARELGIPAGRFLYVGDTGVDMITARRTGMRPIGAGWGFRDHQELREHGAATIIDHPMDLLTILGE